MSQLPLGCQYSSEYTEIGSWDQAPKDPQKLVEIQIFVNARSRRFRPGCKAVQNHTIQCTIARHILMIHAHECEQSGHAPHD